MIDKIFYISIDGVDYPMAFTANVIEAIQDEFGSISKWGELIEPEKTEENPNPEPNLKNIIWTCREMINEGIDINNEEKQEKRPLLSHKQVGRIITKYGITESARAITSVASESSSKGEEKNLMTTQDPS